MLANAPPTLQESGVLSLADLAVAYSLNTELLRSTISSRMGSIIKGQLEGGLLYTPAYVRNIKAQLRGALRGTAAPVALTALVKSIGLEGFSSGHSMLAQLVEELVSEGAVQGSTKGGGGSWVPTVHTAAQQSAVAGFYNQNGWVAYDLVRKAGISSEKTYLGQKFPDGIPLETGVARDAAVANCSSLLVHARHQTDSMFGCLLENPLLYMHARQHCQHMHGRTLQAPFAARCGLRNEGCAALYPRLLRCCCRCVPAVFVSPSLIAQTDASVEETLRNGSWLDVATVLPPSLGPSDVGQLLDKSAEISRDTEHKKGQVGKRGACTGTGAPMSCT